MVFEITKFVGDRPSPLSLLEGGLKKDAELHTIIPFPSYFMGDLARSVKRFGEP